MFFENFCCRYVLNNKQSETGLNVLSNADNLMDNVALSSLNFSAGMVALPAKSASSIDALDTFENNDCMAVEVQCEHDKKRTSNLWQNVDDIPTFVPSFLKTNNDSKEPQFLNKEVANEESNVNLSLNNQQEQYDDMLSSVNQISDCVKHEVIARERITVNSDVDVNESEAESLKLSSVSDICCISTNASLDETLNDNVTYIDNAGDTNLISNVDTTEHEKNILLLKSSIDAQAADLEVVKCSSDPENSMNQASVSSHIKTTVDHHSVLYVEDTADAAVSVSSDNQVNIKNDLMNVVNGNLVTNPDSGGLSIQITNRIFDWNFTDVSFEQSASTWNENSKYQACVEQCTFNKPNTINDTQSAVSVSSVLSVTSESGLSAQPNSSDSTIFCDRRAEPTISACHESDISRGHIAADPTVSVRFIEAQTSSSVVVNNCADQNVGNLSDVTQNVSHSQMKQQQVRTLQNLCSFLFDFL